MHSAIYRGTLRHRRLAERPHAFTHGVALVYLDLDELDGLVDGRLIRPRGILRFCRSDYLGDPDVPLADAVRAEVASRLGAAHQGPTRLLTQLRSFGHCFNPVSFYYCFSAGDEQLVAIVAEVTNTPRGQRHRYVLPCPPDAGVVFTGAFDKKLPLSPFLTMDQTYRWRANRPADTLCVHVDAWHADRLVLDATLALRRLPFTDTTLRWMAHRYPAATLRTLSLIYLHATALALKGVTIKSQRPTQ